MRRQENGRDMQIIYLRMMLLSIDKGGYIYYQGVYDSIEEELAEEFDESVELVRKTIEFLVKNRIISIDEDDNYFLPEAKELVGSETDSAERMRRMRKKHKTSQCNEDVTECDTEIEKEKEEKLEIEREVDKTENVTESVTLNKDNINKINKDNINYQLIVDMYNNTCVSFPRLTKLSDTRKKAIKARMNTYTVEDFKKLFELAEGSSFLKGQNNRNWSATFDWLIKDSNMAKVLDGNYTDRNSRTVQQEEKDKLYAEQYETVRKAFASEYVPEDSDLPFS